MNIQWFWGRDLNGFVDIQDFRKWLGPGMLLGQPLSPGFQILNFLSIVFYGLSYKDRYYLSLHSVRCANTASDVQTTIIRLSEAVPMRPFFRVKNGGRWRMNHTRGRNLRGKCIVCLFNLSDCMRIPLPI